MGIVPIKIWRVLRVLLLQRDCGSNGKFTWIGKNVEYILNHPDFNAMTNEK